MYNASDPRAKLGPTTSAAPTTGLIAEEQSATFYDSAPQISNAGGKTWFVRGQNFVLAYSELTPGATLNRNGQADEYVVLLPEAGATLVAGSERFDVLGNTIAMVPPGDSSMTMPEGGRVVRLFTAKSKDLADLCHNASAYDEPRSHIPDFRPWPMPPDGFKIRHYSLDVPKQAGRFGRIFRCSTFMVNVLDAYDGPRDTTKMSPHSHDDFEQCSLLLEGSYIHYLRWPWTTDMADWKSDKAIEVQAPSALVIPPPVVHTSRAIGPVRNQLVDIFCPPRGDFSAKQGWVLNAKDYPMPDERQ